MKTLKEFEISFNDTYGNLVRYVQSAVRSKGEFSEELKGEISLFGFTLEDLVNEAPKQQATRENAINLSQKISKEEEFVSFMYLKRRLPIKKIVLRFGVTEKVVKRSKKFIISVVIIIDKNLSALKNWIRK